MFCPVLEKRRLADIILEVAPALKECTIVLFKRDEDSDILRVQSACGPAASRFVTTSRALTDRVVGWVAANSTSIYNADARLDASSSAQFGTCTAIPILNSGVAAGVLATYTPTGRSLTSIDLSGLEAVALALSGPVPFAVE
jgi:hypothetical protein